MDNSWVLLSLLSIAALAFISKILYNPRRPDKKLPPGPKPWPIIGNLNLIGSLPHQSLHSLSQKHGEIMLLKFGKFPVVVASSPEMAKQFLKTHDAVFSSRPALAAGKYTAFNFSDMAWAPYGPYLRQARKIYLSEVFNAKRLDSFEQIRVEEGRSFISRLFSQSGKPVVLRDYLSRYTLSIISRMMLGDKYFSESQGSKRKSVEKLDELRGMLDEWFYLNGVFNIGDWIPWLSFLDLQDLLAGGTDTSATTVEWTIHELLKNPHIIEKAKEELDRVIGRDRWVQESDFTKLPYIDAVIMESMRLHPLTTLLPPHYAIEDCNVAGYGISKGTTVFINTWSMGRDPTIWDEPEKFSPERFSGKSIDMLLGNNFALLPFGSGRRGCPGYSLGLKVVRKMLANLIHGFEMKLVEGMRGEDICMEEEYGLTTHPKNPLTIIMEPTLPSHLYS